MFSHHSDPDHHHQSETVKNFKLRFKSNMKQFKERVESRANESGFSGNWRDIAAGAGISAVGVAGGTAVTVLGIVGIIGAAATAGVSLAVAVAGIGVAAGFGVYRSKKKHHEYKQAVHLLQRDDFEKELSHITDKLCNLYQFQLENCSPNDAIHLADACFKALKHEMLENKRLKFSDLLKASHLQAAIVKSASHVEKHAITINGREDEKANTRGAIKRAALYCEESGQLHRAKSSKPAKYGVLFFSTKKELEDYKLQIEKIKCDKDDWQFEKMPASQVKSLERNQLFHRHRIHDDVYQSVDDDSELEISPEKSFSI